MRAGAEVRALDLAAATAPPDAATLLDVLRDWRPQVVGVTLFSETALRGYGLRQLARGRDGGAVWLAGGPHATFCPEEVLSQGFDAVAVGEGEATLVAALEAVAAGRRLDGVAGLLLPDVDGRPRRTAARAPLRNLDTLAMPTEALHVFDRAAYVGDSGRPLPPTLLASRGCPYRCIFCASDHLGPLHRRHSPERVLAEMRAWHDSEGVPVFSFADAAFCLQPRTLQQLCAALRTLPFKPMWWCETRADRLDRAGAVAMAEAGCLMVIVGIESGDPEVSQAIGKGLDLERAAATIAMLDEVGIRVHTNFMFGFPGESAAQIDNTLRYMERIAPHVNFFHPMGLVVPYPGTPLYARHHAELGCTRWWLDPGRLRAMNAAPSAMPDDPAEAMATHAEVRERGLLEAALVPHTAEVRAAIERCLAFRRDFNRERVRGLLRGCTTAPP